MEKDESLMIARHSMAHVLAKAILEIYPKTKLTIGPAIDDGFYYDIDLNKSITADDFKAIEDKMAEIIKRDEAFIRKEISKKEALALFSANPYKCEIINELPENEVISVYFLGEDFVDLCLDTTRELEKEFHALYKSAGFSCNLTDNYSSISKNTQKISQKSFLDLYKKGLIYHAEAPALWCTECRTAVAQSELENQDIASTFNYIKFFIEGTQDFVVVATTRPEMLPACDCVFVNPKDEKAKINQTKITKNKKI